MFFKTNSLVKTSLFSGYGITTVIMDKILDTQITLRNLKYSLKWWLKKLQEQPWGPWDALHLVNKWSTAVSLYKGNSSNHITNCLYIVTWTDANCSLHCGILLQCVTFATVMCNTFRLCSFFFCNNNILAGYVFFFFQLKPILKQVFTVLCLFFKHLISFLTHMNTFNSYKIMFLSNS